MKRLIERANSVLGGLPDAIAMALSPPAIEALGNSSGFAFRLRDKAQQGHAARVAARDRLLKAAQQSPGFASGAAMAEMERLAGELPAVFDFAWTGQPLQEKLSGSQAISLLALALFCVFLCLAALYES